MTQRVVAIVSGGMDSTVLAYDLAYSVKGENLTMLSVNYGQRHKKELAYAEATAVRLEAEWHCVDLTSVQSLLGGSALTDERIDVPHGHYAAETMKATVVPNRNAIMLSVATGVAVAKGAIAVATGVHAGDHAIYPDCRPEFIAAFEAMALIANEGFIHPDFVLAAPFVHKTKADIARLGNELGVPWELTWSCYEGGDVHCGLCSTCVERREAFDLADVTDPTTYADTTDSWRQVVAQ
jgi:7-cyano-7-deazaguanine synthase